VTEKVACQLNTALAGLPLGYELKMIFIAPIVARITEVLFWYVEGNRTC
jgi:hypothetical protein